MSKKTNKCGYILGRRHLAAILKRAYNAAALLSRKTKPIVVFQMFYRQFTGFENIDDERHRVAPSGNFCFNFGQSLTCCRSLE